MATSAQVIDPIPEMSTLALEKGLPLHVDACFGGFMLPWVDKLGYKITPFDFRNPGVTSVSADIHKVGSTHTKAGCSWSRKAGSKCHPRPFF